MSAEVFAKEFHTQHGQVIAMKQQNEDGPEVRLYFKPSGLGVCEQGFQFDDNDEGQALQDACFADLSLEKIEQTVGQLVAMFKDAGL